MQMESICLNILLVADAQKFHLFCAITTSYKDYVITFIKIIAPSTADADSHPSPNKASSVPV